MQTKFNTKVERKSTPRRLIDECIRRLEHNNHVADQTTYQLLLQAGGLLLKSERILLSDPTQIWPLIPRLKQSRWGNDAL